jgi:tetratricopeptide (TPR) repeat protein
MNLNRKNIFGAMCAALLLLSTQVSALTLGRMRGGALLGRELDVSVNIQVAADEEISVSCFSAKLRYGESQVDAARTSLTLQPSAQANTQSLRITSRAPVDDALVGVNLSYACGAKASRSYVLLSDVVSEPAAPAPLAHGVPAAADPVAPAGSRVAEVAPAGAAKAAVKTKPAATAARPKLRLAAVAAPGVREANATAMQAVNSKALQDLESRVDEIAKRQAGSGESADEVQKREARTKALEADVQGLKLITAKNQQNLQMVAKAVESAQEQDYGRSLVYGLLALLALCLAALAYVVMRLRSKGSEAAPWWLGGERAAVAAPRREAAQPVRVSEPVKAAPPPIKVAPSPAAPVPHTPAVQAISPKVLPPVAPVSAAVVKAAAAPSADFVPSGHAHLKAINTKEMLDVRQQADFFMALGQHDEAVRLLETSISGSPDANPLVYLDLLTIFHTLSRRAEFERYREEFNAQFTGRVPAYANFLQEGNGLEAYDDIAQQIVVLWPTEYTIDFIEQCLVRMPEDEPDQGIDLEAFKDLLLLYGVLRRLDQTMDSAMMPFQASRTANSQIGPLSETTSNATRPMAMREAVQPLPEIQPPPLPVIDTGVDLDLDLDLSEELPKETRHDNLIDFDISGFKKP